MKPSTLPMHVDAETALQMTLSFFNERLSDLYVLTDKQPTTKADLAFLEKAMRTYADLRIAENSHK